MAEPPGRARLLDAAERLFAEQGIDATSARAINAAADLSSAALHYHFGNKDALVSEVLRRRMGTINQRRIAKLAREQGRDRTDGHHLAELIVLPLTEFILENQSAGRSYVRFLSRMYGEKTAQMNHFLETEFAEGVAIFDAMVVAAAPHVSREEARGRRRLAGQTATHGLAQIFAEDMEEVDQGEVQAMVRSLVAFIAGGLVAPVSE